MMEDEKREEQQALETAKEETPTEDKAIDIKTSEEMTSEDEPIAEMTAENTENETEGNEMINTEKVYRGYGEPDDRKITIDEMIAKIVNKTGITKEQACEALEKNNNDLLDAMIYVERTYGQASQAARQTQYTGAPQQSAQQAQQYTQQQYSQQQYTQQTAQPNASAQFVNEQKGSCGYNFKSAAQKIGSALMNNSLVIYKDGQEVTSFPLLLAVIALLVSFNAVAIIAIGAMFFGVSYRFRGPNFTAPKANIVLDTIYGMAKTLKTTLMGTKQV